MGFMPALPHPLTLEDQLLARNRGRLRRELWGQSLFVALAYAALALLGLLLWLRVDPVQLGRISTMVERHQVALAVLALLAGVAATHARLVADARRHFASSHAALPIWRDTQAARDRRLRTRLVLRAALGFALVPLLLALRNPAAAWAMAGALRWSLAAAFLAIVFAPGANVRAVLAQDTARRARPASLPRWLGWMQRPALPHLPQWWWQRSASLWLRGRAAASLAIGLLLAPTDAAAILVPISVLMLMALLNALDVAHRLGSEVESALAQRPPSPRVLSLALRPLHAMLSLAAATRLALLLQSLQAPAVLAVLVAAAVLLLSAIDLRLALLLRREPHRLTLVRTQVLLVLAATAGAMPLLLPLLAPALLIACEQRLRAESAHA
ncbi:MAG: hypothetical protein IT478_17120 [Xanthomonadales bacterium]|nr:hypothetical protein [Xanthomonadales bacterium]